MPVAGNLRVAPSAGGSEPEVWSGGQDHKPEIDGEKAPLTPLNGSFQELNAHPADHGCHKRTDERRRPVELNPIKGEMTRLPHRSGDDRRNRQQQTEVHRPGRGEPEQQ